MTKFAVAAALLLSVAASSMETALAKKALLNPQNLRNSPAMKKLLQQSRRLEDEQSGDEDEEDDMDFLQDYSLKFVTCKAGESIVNEEGEYEYSSVVFRLCSGDCDSDSALGCSKNYGDHVVGINTFMDAYFEMVDEENDDEFDLKEYSDCKEFEQEEDDEEGEGEDRKKKRRKLDEDQKDGPFYIGPECTSDGSNIQLNWFSDETCTTYEEVYSYGDYNDGADLPYSDTDLVATDSCYSCLEKNDDGEYETSEFCKDNYENAGHCETNQGTYSDNGIDESSCESISAMMPKSSSGGGAGKFFLWLLFVLVVVGVAFYFLQKKKSAKAAGVDNSGLMA